MGLAAGLVLVAVTLPYWQTQQVMGFSRTLEDNLTWSAQPLDFLSVSLHNRTYARLLPQADPEPLFAGFTALLLAAGGMVVALRRRRTGPAAAQRAEFGFYGLLLATGVVLALGPDIMIGAWTIPLPYRLLALLPGAGALRAPVRAMVLVNLALGVFAGLGAAHLLALRLPGLPSTARGARRAAGHALRGLLLGCLVTLILIEQQVAPLALAALPASAADQPAAYQWLAAHPDGGVLIEMPVGLGLRDPTVESTHMYYQTWHGHPLVGGYSGFRPPTYVEIYARLDAQYDSFTAERLGILQSLGVRYLLYHEANYKRSAWARVAAGLAAFPQVHEIGAFPVGADGPDHLYRLDPRPADAVIRVEAAPGPTAGTATVVLTNTGAMPLLTRLRPTLDLALPDGRRLAVPAPLTLPPGSARFTVPLAGPALAAGTPLTPLAPAPDTLAPASAQDLP